MAIKNNISRIQSNPDSRFFGLLVKKVGKKTNIQLVYKNSDIDGRGWGFAIAELKPSKTFQLYKLNQKLENAKNDKERALNTLADLHDDLVTIANSPIPEVVDASVLTEIRDQFLRVLDKHGIDYDLDTEDEGYDDEDEDE